MPPRKKAAVKATPASLENCHIAFATARIPAKVLGGSTLAEVKSDILAHKGQVVADADQSSGCTHLVATAEQYRKLTGKVPQAADNDDVKIVSFDWLEAALASNTPVDETKFILHDRGASQTTSNDVRATSGRKRGRKAADADIKDDNDDDDAAKTTNKKVKSEPVAEEKPERNAQKASSNSLNVPVDDGVPQYLKVHIDDDGMIYDAALNQTNSGNNNNKFYRLQILKDSKGMFSSWSRWGRVGERGQSKMNSSLTFDDALKEFQKKFKDKSGHTWDDRHGPMISGKYTFIEKNYEDSDDEEEDDSKPGKGGSGVKKEDEEEEKPVDSKLPEPVQRLMDLIFNLDYFNSTFDQLNYDAKKMPLGKLSKRTLLRGYDVLKDLANLVAQVTVNTGAITEKSDQYFSLIPHAFGRSKPPVLRDMNSIKREIELLDTLTDMGLANDIMKEAKSKQQEKVHLRDRQYEGLGMQEMTPLDPSSTEFGALSDYLTKSVGATHHFRYTVHDIFRIERKGEFDRFDQSKFGSYASSDRRLLWHGSRCTNFGGILSQGLRIAPPEAPVSGYMFGKGIYLADMSSKSANYCCSYSSGNTGLLLLCEAELGAPPLKLTNADYNAGDRATQQGSISTWGVGTTAPKGWTDAGFVNSNLRGVLIPDLDGAGVGPTNEAGAGLLYNEFIAYDVAQVKLRYLLRVEMR